MSRDVWTTVPAETALLSNWDGRAGMAKHKEYLRIALEEARLGESEGQIPIGCVIVGEDGSLLARTHNRVAELDERVPHRQLKVGGDSQVGYPTFRDSTTAWSSHLSSSFAFSIQSWAWPMILR